MKRLCKAIKKKFFKLKKKCTAQHTPCVEKLSKAPAT
jgi:hypothetical protein